MTHFEPICVTHFEPICVIYFKSICVVHLESIGGVELIGYLRIIQLACSVGVRLTAIWIHFVWFFYLSYFELVAGFSIIS